MESSCSIELKVISSKDLKAFNFFQKLLVYALVSIISDDPNKKLDQDQQQRTPTDKEGDGNPEWNHEMRFHLSEAVFQDCDHLFIQFELRHEGIMFGDKTIGEVRVPFRDLIQESSGIVRFVSYEVRSADGKPNGVLNFSHKASRIGQDIGVDSLGIQITGFPILHQHHQPPEIQYPSSEVQSGSPKIQYPSIDSEHNFQEPQALSSTLGNQYSFPANPYPPPDVYYHPPPPFPPLMGPPPPRPPPPHLMHSQPPPLPPAPFAYGACYHPSPAGIHHWGHHAHGYSSHGAQDSAAGHLEEIWQKGWHGSGNRHSSSWNGR